ncbi:MAG: hypothetical protein ACM33C_04850 [Syntrophaceae bacterium]
MIFHPAIIALLLSSAFICFMVLYSASCGIQIVRRWDLSSGSETQLSLERKTYLVSSMLSCAFGFQLMSLFLFVYTADRICPFFVGAMCAAGSLNANAYGYPVLLFKVMNFLLAGFWLLLNFTDNRAPDYPLIRKRYILLLALALLLPTEAVLQANYFARLSPNIITSCCGSLFSGDAAGGPADLAALPAAVMKVVFFSVMALTIGAGGVYYVKGKGGVFFCALSAISFVVCVLSILSFISPYIYELPTHHCPFCLLQKEYGYIGYPLYLALFTATILGTGVGILMPFRSIDSLSEIIPSIQKRITLAAVILFSVFLLIVAWKMIFTAFILEG